MYGSHCLIYKGGDKKDRRGLVAIQRTDVFSQCDAVLVRIVPKLYVQQEKVYDIFVYKSDSFVVACGLQTFYISERF